MKESHHCISILTIIAFLSSKFLKHKKDLLSLKQPDPKCCLFISYHRCWLIYWALPAFVLYSVIRVLPAVYSRICWSAISLVIQMLNRNTLNLQYLSRSVSHTHANFTWAPLTSKQIQVQTCSYNYWPLTLYAVCKHWFPSKQLGPVNAARFAGSVSV